MRITRGFSVIILSLLAVSVILLVWYMYRNVATRDTNLRLETIEESSSAVARQFDEAIEFLSVFPRISAHRGVFVDALETSSYEQAQGEITRLANMSPYSAGMFLVDRHGIVVAHPAKNGLGIDVTEQPFWRAYQANPETATIAPLLDPSPRTGAYGAIVGEVIRNAAGQFLGIAAMPINFPEAGRSILFSRSLVPSERHFVFDAEGTVLLTGGDADDLDVPHSTLLSAASEGRRGVLAYSRASAKDGYIVFTPLKSLNCFVGVSFSRDDLIAPARKLLRDLTLMGFVAGLIIELVVWIGLLIIANSAKSLRRATAAVRGGSYDITFSKTMFTELDELASDFRAMLNAIKEREERMRSLEADARRNETRYRSLVENLSVGVLVHRPDTTIAMCNKAACGILGLPEGSAIVQSSSDDPEWRITRPDSTPLPVDEYPAIQAIKSKKAVTQKIFGIEKPSQDNLTWVLVNTFPFFDSRNELDEVVSTFFDISAIRNAEEEQRLFKSRAQESQKLESLGVLAGGVAHDFNNLLTTIMGNAELVQMDPEISESTRKHIASIELATTRAADLARQMLVYSGKGKFTSERLHLNTLLEEMILLLKASISSRIALVCSFDSAIPLIECDATQVRQVIMNLVINAAEAIVGEKGRVVITTGKVARCDIDLTKSHCDVLASTSEFCYLEVSDNGAGIEADVLKGIFEPFFSSKTKGRGLGLAMVSGIVRGHRGAIEVHTELGKGTTFRVFLPACENRRPYANATATPLDLRSDSLTLAEKTILLVDDEEAIRVVVKAMLEKLGMAVATTESGERAIDLVRDNPERFSCVLLDLTTPGMRGDEVFFALRNIRANLPVILSTGFDRDEVAAGLLQEGLAGFLKKPYRLEELRQALRTVYGEDSF